ncbi:FapA family protein, partial [Sulfurimonas sp.]|nr:FapA family protein [Sulfurimonas sp.]
ATISKDIKFTVASSLIPIEPINASLEKIYEKKSVESESIIAGVDKGELIARYTLTKDGVDGRACTGKFISVEKAILIDKEPEIDATVKKEVFKTHIEYYAHIDGYPIIQKNILSISNNLQLKEATFKSTANINSGGQDIDISVNIKHDKTHNEDAIGSGVNIDVKELNVDGSIASNVSIATDNLNVDAQTHKKSKMVVKDNANIKLHRGDLTTKNAEIDILESGKVTASESIKVRQMLGGVVIAPIVKIDEVLANTTIIASELIEIKSILGEHNKLIIDPDSIASYHKEIEELQEKIQNKQRILKEEESILEDKAKEHASKIDRIKTFQKRVLAATKAGKAPMKQDILRVKQYKKDSDRLALAKVQLKEQSLTILPLEEKLDKFCNKDLHAKIKSNTIYDGHTKVIFVNMKTREELFYIPKGTTPEIFLTLDENKKRVISTN